MSLALRLGRLSTASLDALVEGVRDKEVTYDFVGATVDLQQWASRPMHVESTSLGAGRDIFDAAVDGLRRWACHPGIGAQVHPADAAIAVGATVLVVLRVGPVRLVVPDRIVAVIDEPDRFGFAYGTLPGHDERGEESFLIEHLPDGTVRATVRVAAVAASLPARAASPIVRSFQHIAARRYLRALRLHVQEVTR